MVDDIFQKIENRKLLFQHYYENFEKHFARGKLSKASEFLWGALHSLIYAIALTYNKKLSNHKQIILFVKEISAEVKDNDIYSLLKIGEDLHANFYHDFLDEEALRLKRIEVDKLIAKLSKILEDRTKFLKDSFVEDTPSEDKDIEDMDNN